MNALTVRLAEDRDRDVIRDVEARAFGGMGEATLVDSLVAANDAVLELVAERDGEIIGHILFSRVFVEAGDTRFPGVALAPAAVVPDWQGKGVGRALIEDAHQRLQASGEKLSVVLGDPAYYGRFGYEHGRAADFESTYQCDALQAIAWGEAPQSGKLVYATPFGAL
jgi:putative acetyltransferase